MGKIIASLFLSLTLCLHINAADSVRVRVTYDALYSYSKEKLETGRAEDVMALDIGEHSSHFYSMLAERKREMTDSLNRIGRFDAFHSGDTFKGMESGQEYNVYKGIPSASELTYCERVFNETFRYTEKKPVMEWTLHDEYLTVAGYSCQKATACFRGRKWTVWFTTDIPVSDGPWKLCGLPGLILKADDDDGIFSFECVGIEKDVNKAVALRKDKYIDCSPEKLQQFSFDWKRNSMSYIEKRFNISFTSPGENNTSRSKDITPLLIEYFDRQSCGE